jgi:hypothetical protein
MAQAMNPRPWVCCFAVAAAILASCERASEDESEAQGEPATPAEIEGDYWCYSADCRAEVRAAAKTYVTRAMPGKTVAGISTNEVNDRETVWVASVDLGAGQPPVEVIVRLFVSETGQTYWLASPLTHEMSGAVDAMATRLLIERSIDAAREAETDRQGGDLGPDPSEYTGP